jgi:hypothetical protein
MTFLRFATGFGLVLLPALLPAQWVVSRPGGKKDSASVTLTVKARTDPAGMSLGRQPTLSIRCDHGRLDVVLQRTTPSPAADPAHQPVRYRIDGAAPVDEFWAGTVMMGELVASEPRELIAAMLNAKRLRFEFHQYTGDPAIVDFSVDGLATKIGQIDASCPATSGG